MLNVVSLKRSDPDCLHSVLSSSPCLCFMASFSTWGRRPSEAFRWACAAPAVVTNSERISLLTIFVSLKFFDRLKLFCMPPKHQPDFIYLRHVPLRKVHLFTIIQLSCLVLLWVIKTSRTAIVFPMMVSWRRLFMYILFFVLACLSSSLCCFSRFWLWFLFASCLISSSLRENWAGWMISCQSGRRRSLRMQQRRCSRRTRCWS